MNFSVLRRSFSLNISKTKSKPHQDLDVEETSLSDLKGKKLPINKILSRDSSFGQSSRIYYGSTTTLGIPFQWEKKPGTPMHPSGEEVILQPPLPPPPPLPPAVQSLELARSNVVMKHSSLSWRFWLWRRRLSRNMRLKIYDWRKYHTKLSSNARGNKVISSSSDSDLDDELVGWVHYDSKSSSSFTSSSSIGLSSEQFDSFRKGTPFCCTTWRRYKSNNK